MHMGVQMKYVTKAVDRRNILCYPNTTISVATTEVATINIAPTGGAMTAVVLAIVDYLAIFWKGGFL